MADLDAVERLLEAGFSESQAKAAAREISLATQDSHAHLATKEDIANLKADMTRLIMSVAMALGGLILAAKFF